MEEEVARSSFNHAIIYSLAEEMRHLPTRSCFFVLTCWVNLPYLWHLLLGNNGVLGVQLLPDAIDRIRFSMSIQKSTFDLCLLCEIVSSAQLFLRLLIVQVRLYQPEQFRFAFLNVSKIKTIIVSKTKKPTPLAITSSMRYTNATSCIPLLPAFASQMQC